MHFCIKCNNMYYIRLSGGDGSDVNQLNNLVYYCRQCNFEDTDLVVDKSLICVSKSYINKKQENYKDIVNEFIENKLSNIAAWRLEQKNNYLQKKTAAKCIVLLSSGLSTSFRPCAAKAPAATAIKAFRAPRAMVNLYMIG